MRGFPVLMQAILLWRSVVGAFSRRIGDLANVLSSGWIAAALAVIVLSVVDPGVASADTLTIVRPGSGTGTVSSNVGIDCGNTCSGNLAAGTPITLTAAALAGSQFTGWLGPCTGTGSCQFVLSGATAVSATFAPTAIGVPSLDIDGTASITALTDGLLVMRYLFGAAGAALIDGAVGTGASRNTAEVLGAYLSDIKPALDIDGNGQADALTDGLLIFRYLSGMRGESLIVGVLGLGATRTTAAAIEAVLAGVRPVFLPPDPAMIAPPVDLTVATNVFVVTAFLYSGATPIQTGVVPGTIDPRRAAVLRGRVLDRAGAPVTGVTITVLAHPEFGQTLSRADGRFDMAVNGGGLLTVNYVKSGLLTLQRQVAVPWQDYRVVDDVVMIPVDAAVTTIASNAASMQVARGSAQSDASGTRRATVLFPAGTSASLVQPGGGTVPAATLNVRFTEYTVGPTGEKAMPGPLPPTSAYTYAIELAADEAVTKVAGRDVVFNQPVLYYVENFLGFPVGTSVPVGFYDRDKPAWLPSDNGRVIKIVGVTGGVADVDTVGARGLPAVSLTVDERQQLAALYAVGQSLWRVPTGHFSTMDGNFPGTAPVDATQPNQSLPRGDDTVDQCLDEAGGSIIECQNQILGESVTIVGTPYTLNYRTANAPGRTVGRMLRIPLSGATPPASLKSIELELSFAGRTLRQAFPPTPNQEFTFTFDGLDAYGRAVQGSQLVSGVISYVYDLVYTDPSGANFAWAQPGQFAFLPPLPGRGQLRLQQQFATHVSALDARPLGMGGWTLSAHHRYDPLAQKAHFGNGRRLTSTEVLKTVVRKVPAASGLLIGALAIAPDGTIWLSISGNLALKRIAVNGQVTNFGPALNPSLAGFTGGAGGMALGPDGRIYITENQLNGSTGNERIWAIDSNGVGTVVAGSSPGFSGDEGPATLAQFTTFGSVAFSADGSMYLADSFNHRIRRVDTNGIIHTVAGNGTQGFSGDGGLATAAQLSFPAHIAVAPDGTLYLNQQTSLGLEGSRIRRVATDGTITTIAGGGELCLFPGSACGDGGPAIFARLSNGGGDMAVGSDGTLYLLDQPSVTSGVVLRQITPDGIISRLAGNQPGKAVVDGMPGLQARLDANFLAISPDKTLYLARGTLLQLVPALPQLTLGDSLIASQDGKQLYDFDAAGRHLRTFNTLTGAVLEEFAYDAAGRLASVTEKTGGIDNVTTIQHDGNGNPVKIVGPFGQETLLTVDANGFLASIVNPAGEAFQLLSAASGLLQKFTDPRGKFSAYTYDGMGRLTQATDMAGKVQTFARTELPNGYSVAKTTSIGRTTTYKVEDLPTGDRKLTTTLPSGETTALLNKQDGTNILTQADGTLVTTVLGPDPRFGMQAPFVSSGTTKTPAGLSPSETGARSASFLNPNDVLSLTSLTDSSTEGGRTLTNTYTASTRTAVGTSAAGRTRTVVHDALGRTVSAQIAGLNATTFAYDSRGRVVSMTRGTGATSRTHTLAYDAQGFLQSATDPLGRTVQYTRDLAGRVTLKTLPGNMPVTFTLNSAGDIVAITPPGKPAHAFAYNGRGDLTSMTPPVVAGSGPTTFTYEQDGLMTQVARPGGEQIGWGYDSAGRANAITVITPGLANASYALAYDASGRLQSVTGPGAQTVANTYDGTFKKSTTWSGPVTGSVSWTFDNSLRVASEVLTGGTPIAFAYDGDDLLTAAGGLAIVRNMQTGLAQSTTLNGVNDNYAFSAFGELAGYGVTASGAAIYSATFGRDAIGRISQKQEAIGGATDTYVYAYDALGQLTQVTRNGTTAESYSYDANGNRTSSAVAGSTTAATYDDQDRLLAFGTTSFSHTPSGKLLSRSAASGTTAYRYDGAGNLLGLTLPGGTAIAYQLDGMDRRVGKLVNGTIAMQFLYSGSRVVAQLDGSGNIVSQFVYANGTVPAYMIRGGSTFRLISDPIGSVRLVVNAATGVIAQRIEYDAFGSVTQDTNPGFQPFGFAGGLYDPDTGLVRFGARDYDAQTGRWTTKDPIAFSGNDTNFYRYSRNDPVNLIDPTGLVTWGDAANFAAGAAEALQQAAVLSNPISLIPVVIDGLTRVVSSALGFPPHGPSVLETLNPRNNELGIDRSSDAYWYGGLTTDITLVCVDVATVAYVGRPLISRGLRALAERQLDRALVREAEQAAARKVVRAEVKAAQEAAERKAKGGLKQVLGDQGSGQGGYRPASHQLR